MSSPVDELVKKAVDLREAGRIEEAVIAARRATALNPDEANAWWQLALAIDEKDGAGAAHPHFEKTVDLAPQFSYGWHRFGLACKKTGQIDRAVNCWERAIEIGDERFDSMRQLLAAYAGRAKDGDDGKVFEVLKRLDAAGKLDTGDLNQLGIAYLNRKDYYKAIIYFRRYAAETAGPVGLFNLGLAYLAQEIGQDVDAIDAWRRALARDPSYSKAATSLASALRPLLDFKYQVPYGKDLIDQEQWFSNYINPFELLKLGEVDDPWDMEVKAIQKAKKSLLQEIDLEDGKIAWMPGLRIDRSMAIKVADELNDEWTRYWHHLVYQNKPLLGFLSRGKLDHFLADADKSPIELLEALEEHSDSFAPWLSKHFAPQYDLALTKAVDGPFMYAVDRLLDGRRWVVPEDEDKCFDGAHRILGRLMQPLRDASERSEKERPSFEGVKWILDSNGLDRLLSQLPLAFQREQSEAVSLIRSISIDAYNHHENADLALAILSLSTPLAAKSPSLKHQIEEDRATLNDRIKQERKREAILTVGNATYKITREGASFGAVTVSATEAATIRWGISITRHGNVATYKFSMAIGGRGATVASVNWASSKGIEEQEKHFDQLVDAASAYLIPTIMEKVRRSLDRGETVQIGPAPVSKAGITFTIAGWFSTKRELCPWNRLRAELSNGNLVLTDSGNRKATISMALKDTNNAFILFMMAKNS